MGVAEADLRTDGRDCEPAPVDRLPREHLREEADGRRSREEQSVDDDVTSLVSLSGAPCGKQADGRIASGEQGKDRVLPTDQRHEPGEQPKEYPLSRRTLLPRHQPRQHEGCYERHGGRMRHARFLDHVPKHERAADGGGGGRGGDSRIRQTRCDTEHEPASKQPVGEAGDADGLPVWKRDAVGGDVRIVPAQLTRDEMAGREERRPHDCGSDRPG